MTLPLDRIGWAFAAGAKRLSVTCACGRIADFEKETALSTFGASACLSELVGHGKCRGCGGRAASASFTWPAPADSYFTAYGITGAHTTPMLPPRPYDPKEPGTFPWVGKRGRSRRKRR